MLTDVDTRLELRRRNRSHLHHGRALTDPCPPLLSSALLAAGGMADMMFFRLVGRSRHRSRFIPDGIEADDEGEHLTIAGFPGLYTLRVPQPQPSAISHQPSVINLPDLNH